MHHHFSVKPFEPMMKRIIFTILIVFLFNFFAIAQSINTAKLDSFFNVLASRNLAMGTLTISKNGKVRYQRAIGYASFEGEKKIPANVDTRYRIGSVSKMYTAAMIFQLIEEGKVNPDQKLTTYFPDLPNADRITIANLLNHRSGLHNYTDGTNYPEWMDKPKTNDEMLRIIKEKSPDFDPGTRAEYSNSNYLLLGYIIEKITGQSYEKVLKDRITSKIKLPETAYMHPIDVEKNESYSYKYIDGNWRKEKETTPGMHGGAGSIISTSSDLVKFIEALFTEKLINKSSLEKMKGMTDGYGMGMFPFDYGIRPGYGHNGRIEEFYTAVRYFPDEKLAIAYCTNGIEYPRTDILNGILKIIFEEGFSIPFVNVARLKSEDFDKYPGKYYADQLPIEVICTKGDAKLLLETKGKVFEVEPIARDYFMHAPTGTFFEFFPEKGELQIKETDNVYYLKRK